MAETDQHAPVRAGTPRVPPTPSPIGRPVRPPRTAHLVLRRVEPWSVLKLLLVLSLAAVAIALVAVTALNVLLDAMGVFDTVGTFTNDIGATGSRRLVTLPTLLAWTGAITAGLALIAAALTTIGCYVYNLVGALVGGPEITFGERV